MVRIAISVEAFEAARTLPLGNVGYEAAPDAKGPRWSVSRQTVPPSL